MSINKLSEFYSFVDRDSSGLSIYRWIVRSVLVWFFFHCILTLFFVCQYFFASMEHHKIVSAKQKSLLQYKQKNHEVVGIISKKEFIYRRGSDIYFKYLSSFDYVDLWLTAITIELNEESITLSGRMLAAKNIENLIEVLQEKIVLFMPGC
ncbi:MAG: hypothetical protein LRY67_02565 [Gammaproteobacteria bacterium]|nr:hypothetical protein [Gammaproteobacteria bacterium]